MIEPVWIVGFTGHRPKDAPGRTSAEMCHLTTTIKSVLEDFSNRAKARNGRAEFLCGVAAGADLVAARVAESLGMAVHVILPLPESLFAHDFSVKPDDPNADQWAADWKEAQRFISLARNGTKGATFRVCDGSGLRDECYYDQGMQIVEASDAIVALWDGTDPEPYSPEEEKGKFQPRRGGTADVVALAQADMMPYLRGKDPKHGYVWRATPCIVIDATTGAVRGSTEDFASKSDAGYAEIEAVIHAARMEFDDLKLQNEPADLMKLVRYGAKDWATRLRRSLLIGSGLHFSGALVAAVAAAAQTLEFFQRDWTPPILAGIELTFVTSAIVLMTWSHLKHSQARWLELRLATELLRGMLGAGRLLDPLFPLATRHLPGWRRFCLSIGLEVWRTTPGGSLHDEKDRYSKDRLRDQLDHYDKYDPHHRHPWHRYAHLAGPIIAFLAVGVVLIAFIHKWEEAVHGRGTLTFSETMFYRFLPIALPLLAGAIASLQSVTDAKRRAHVYPELVARLRGSLLFIQSVRTPAALCRFVRRTEEVLIDELVGWYAAAKSISH